MATEVQTQAGRCSTHGTVEATREVPKMGFPFVVYAVWRAVAQRRPFRCPECGTAVRASSPVTAGRCTPITSVTPTLDTPPGRVSTTTAATGTSCVRPDRSSAASSTGWPASGARASAVCWGLQSRWDSIITACALLTAVAVAGLASSAAAH